jgi:hypothetical protein
MRRILRNRLIIASQARYNHYHPNSRTIVGAENGY